MHPAPPADVAWLQPYPDTLLSAPTPLDGEPETMETMETGMVTMELAFLASIQRLPARQRAVLILRDVLDRSAGNTATALDMTGPGVGGAGVQRHPGGLKPRRQRRVHDAQVPGDAHHRRPGVDRYKSTASRRNFSEYVLFATVGSSRFLQARRGFSVSTIRGQVLRIRLASTSSWSTRSTTRNGAWWLAHMMPICRKLAMEAPI